MNEIITAESKQLKQINRAYIAGIITAVTSSLMPYLFKSSWDETLITISLYLTLAWGTSQRSRVCSTLLFACFVGGSVWQMINTTSPLNAGLGMRLLFSIWYYTGMIATFDWHRSKQKSEENLLVFNKNDFEFSAFSWISIKNYVYKHWRGELSALTSTLINLWLVSYILYYATLVAGKLMKFLTTNLAILAAIILVLIAGGLAILIWQLVGTVRSLLRLRRVSPMTSNISVLWMSVILFLVTNLYMCTATYMPLTKELYLITQGDPQYPAFTLEVLPSGNEIEIRGGIQAGSAAKLSALLESAPHIKTLHINSLGGRSGEARQMVKLISKRGLDTYVSDECASAGAYIFLAGKNRFANRNAKIGFHSASLPGLIADDMKDANTEIQEILQKVGSSKSFIEKAINTPANEMWYPEMDMLIAEKVVTDISLGDKFGSSAKLSDSILDLDFLKNLNSTLPYLELLEKKFPGTLADMASKYDSEIASGKTIGIAENEAKKILGDAVAKIPKVSTPETERAMMLYLTAFYENCGDATAADKQSILENKPLSGGRSLLAVFPHYPVQAENDFLVATLTADQNVTKNLWDPEIAKKDFYNILDTMKEKYPDQFSVYLTDEADASKYSEDQKDQARLKLFQIARDVLPADRQGNWFKWYQE
jgi:ATP-dependent protease ClpP protease subunit